MLTHNSIYLKSGLSQQASRACDASQLLPDRLVVSITGVVIQLQLVNIRQHNIVPEVLGLPQTTSLKDSLVTPVLHTCAQRATSLA